MFAIVGTNVNITSFLSVLESGALVYCLVLKLSPGGSALCFNVDSSVHKRLFALL